MVFLLVLLQTTSWDLSLTSSLQNKLLSEKKPHHCIINECTFMQLDILKGWRLSQLNFGLQVIAGANVHSHLHMGSICSCQSSCPADALFLGCGRKLEELQRSHADTGRTCDFPAGKAFSFRGFQRGTAHVGETLLRLHQRAALFNVLDLSHYFHSNSVSP